MEEGVPVSFDLEAFIYQSVGQDACAWICKTGPWPPYCKYRAAFFTSQVVTSNRPWVSICIELLICLALILPSSSLVQISLIDK